jgi:signal transduction histidine kinase
MSRFRPMSSIRLKLLAAILATTAVALLVAGVAMLILSLRDYHEAAVRDIRTQLILLGRVSAPALQFGDPLAAAENLGLLDIRPNVQAAALYDARGQLFASYVRYGHEGELPRFPGNEEVWVEAGAGTMSAFHRVVGEDQILGTIYARTAYDLRDRLVEGLGVVALIIVMALVVAVFISGWLQSFLIGPMLSIAATAREVVTRRDYSLRATKMSNDEVGTLVDAFNAMLAEIEARAGELERSNTGLQNEIAERSRVEREVWRLNRELDSRVRERTLQLENANAELESFAYSVSHDLRAPLRSIDGYSEALVEDLGDTLPAEARRYLDKIRGSTRRMGQLIEDLLNLSRLSRADLRPTTLDLSAMARQVVDALRQGAPGREVEITIWENMKAVGDPRLVRIALENLLENAWKFTGGIERPAIEVGSMQEEGRSVYFVRDNGVGFDMAYSGKLFGVFQRLHGQNEFPGTGIGLATVHRIVQRHGGRIWVNAAPGKGAVFFFTLSDGEYAQAEKLQ